MNKKVIVIGAGGHSKVIGEIIQSSQDELIGYLDDNITGENIIGTIQDVLRLHEKDEKIEFIIGIGNNEVRNKIYQEYPQLNYYTAIHPSAIISPSARVGVGTVIMANVVINSNTTVGDNCIINTATVIEHDCTIENGVHLSYRVTVGAGSIIGKEAYIDMGAIIARGVTVQSHQKIDIKEIIR